jgi:NAD-dependent deacetylase
MRPSLPMMPILAKPLSAPFRSSLSLSKDRFSSNRRLKERPPLGNARLRFRQAQPNGEGEGMAAIRNIVVLTGAGISAESGLRTFRAEDGLWEDHRVEDVATPDAFRRDPDLVQRFYDERRRNIIAARPNAAHQALARLDREWPGELLIVTQNIDDLHERAGAERVLHMHGEGLSAWCTACEARHRWTGTLRDDPPCPSCGARALELNLERSQGSLWFDETRLGPASERVPEWVEEALGGAPN